MRAMILAAGFGMRLRPLTETPQFLGWNRQITMGGTISNLYGGKIGIDATRKLPAEGYTRGWPTPVEMSESIKERVSRRWSMYGFDS